MSVRFPVEIQSNDGAVSQGLGNTGHDSIEVLYIYFFIIIFLFLIPSFVLFFLFVPLVAHVYN